jgi:hypothetical protein
MNKILLAFFIISSTFIYCDARRDCYEHSTSVNVAPGVCELFTVLLYDRYANASIEISTGTQSRLFLLCLRQEQGRNKCDNKSQYWPLPKNFNQGKNRGL